MRTKITLACTECKQRNYDQGEEEPSRENGNQKVLQILQEAHAAQGNQIIAGRPRGNLRAFGERDGRYGKFRRKEGRPQLFQRGEGRIQENHMAGQAGYAEAVRGSGGDFGSSGHHHRAAGLCREDRRELHYINLGRG